MTVYVSPATAADPKVPAWGGKFALSTYLANRVRGIMSDPQLARSARASPRMARDAACRSQLPGRHELLVETFPRRRQYFLVCYPFEGRLAHTTLAMLLTRRLERDGALGVRLQ